MVESLVTSLDSVDKEKTTKVSSLVKELLDTKKAIDSAEDHLKSLKKKAESISSEQIPNLMTEMQIEGLKTPHGSIEVVQK